VGWFGTVPLAAHGIVIQISALSFMVPLGIANMATIRAGNALGRKDALGLRRASWVALAMGLMTSLVTVTAFLVFPNQLVALFINAQATDTEQIIRIGTALMVAAAAFQILDAMQVIGLGLLRGVRDTSAPMVIAVFAYWVLGIPGGYYLGFQAGMGPQGVWMGLVIGLGFAAVVLLWRYWVMLARITRKLAPPPV